MTSGEPDADLELRLMEVYRRYEAAFRQARPGTLAAAELSRARLDLLLLLERLGEPLASELLAQADRDAAELFRATPALPEPADDRAET